MCSFAADREDYIAWLWRYREKRYPQMTDDQTAALVAAFTQGVPNMIKRQIDLKHHVDENFQIVKTGNGVPVPDNEPLILFRGRDRLAIPMLLAYRDLCIQDGCNDFQLGQIDELIEKFRGFALENPQTMKQPGITRGL